jgi:hypothetical protein
MQNKVSRIRICDLEFKLQIVFCHLAKCIHIKIQLETCNVAKESGTTSKNQIYY